MGSSEIGFLAARKSECFPLWNIKRKRARYQADQKGNRKDTDSWDELCSKLFPEHTRLTPGLFIVTYFCPKKKVYGFKKMIQGESPRIIFFCTAIIILPAAKHFSHIYT